MSASAATDGGGEEKNPVRVDLATLHDDGRAYLDRLWRERGSRPVEVVIGLDLVTFDDALRVAREHGARLGVASRLVVYNHKQTSMMNRSRDMYNRFEELSVLFPHVEELVLRAVASEIDVAALLRKINALEQVKTLELRAFETGPESKSAVLRLLGDFVEARHGDPSKRRLESLVVSRLLLPAVGDSAYPPFYTRLARLKCEFFEYNISGMYDHGLGPRIARQKRADEVAEVLGAHGVPELVASYEEGYDGTG
jgi:hypothetical protein